MPNPLATSPNKILPTCRPPHSFAITLLYLAALALAAWSNRFALNPDGVAYLRIAKYYAGGNFDLALSGYWGPLISWLMAPGLALGLPPLAAARTIMALSAIAFVWSAHELLEVFQLSQNHRRLGTALAAILALFWSIENVTPDLLAGAFIAAAARTQLHPRWLSSPAQSFLCGAFWGLAYLTKPVAFPLALLTFPSLAGPMLLRAQNHKSEIAQALIRTGIIFLVISAPWIFVLSTHYGQLTISRSATLNHAMVGPSNVTRFYPLDRGLHQPDPGRVTSWEDPVLPYPDWSPFASSQNFLHQLKIIGVNLPKLLFMLTSLFLLAPVLLLYPLWRMMYRLSSKTTFSSAFSDLRQVNAAIPIAALALLYLPGNLLISEQRYLYAVFPFFFTLSILIVEPIRRVESAARANILLLIVATSFLAPTAIRPWLRRHSPSAGAAAWQLATKIQQAALAGSVAGSARMPGGRPGLYVAFFLDQPWLGDPLGDPSTSALQALKRSSARLIITQRGSIFDQAVGSDPAFLNLDKTLFGLELYADLFPLRADLLPP